MLRPLIKSFLWRAIFQSEKGNHSGKGNWGEGKEEGGLWKRRGRLWGGGEEGGLWMRGF